MQTSDELEAIRDDLTAQIRLADQQAAELDRIRKSRAFDASQGDQDAVALLADVSRRKAALAERRQNLSDAEDEAERRWLAACERERIERNVQAARDTSDAIGVVMQDSRQVDELAAELVAALAKLGRSVAAVYSHGVLDPMGRGNMESETAIIPTLLAAGIELRLYFGAQRQRMLERAEQFVRLPPAAARLIASDEEAL